MHFAACRILAATEQSNPARLDHTADPSLSSPADGLRGEQ